jgi:hypothetical protein
VHGTGEIGFAKERADSTQSTSKEKKKEKEVEVEWFPQPEWRTIETKTYDERDPAMQVLSLRRI